MLIFLILAISPNLILADENTTYWEIQSIDTMKFSRDLAREKLNDKSFEELINLQVEEISKTGATHVAVGTPYDNEFIPFLKKWVTAARTHNLKIWFRGNLSGWEGWFEYPRITSDDHLRDIVKFIRENSDLFEDGDIFTPCTECENGGPGDPRNTGDILGYRNFLIAEFRTADGAFKKIGKKVTANYFSMNGDVANLIMDKKTTEDLGGVVVIDHYVDDPERLSSDLKRIIMNSGGKVILGEFGVPIPDIHGEMTESQQAIWLDSALSELSFVEGLIGINYWTSFGGTTSIWNSNGVKKSAVDVLSSYYSPKTIEGKIKNEFDQPLTNVELRAESKVSDTDKNGYFKIFIVPSTKEVTISAEKYEKRVLSVQELENVGEIVLEKSNKGIFFKLQMWFYNMYKSLTIQ